MNLALKQSVASTGTQLQVMTCLKAERHGYQDSACMLFSLKGPIQKVCYVYVCDLTFCVSLVVHLGRLRVTVSEFEASRGPHLCVLCYSTVLLFFFFFLFKDSSESFMRAFLSHLLLFVIVALSA